MTKNIALALEPTTRARILLDLDHHLRETIKNEELFMVWLEEGVPDGTADWRDLEDLEVEDFVEICNLARHLLEQEGW